MCGIRGLLHTIFFLHNYFLYPIKARERMRKTEKERIVCVWYIRRIVILHTKLLFGAITGHTNTRDRAL